jgi:Fe-S-cluster containining protein
MYNRDVVNLKEAVASAASRQDVRAAVAGVYARLQREIDARKPVCNTSGRCCRFDEFGHRLYVTTMELAAFTAQLDRAGDRSVRGDCPFQIDGLCAVHTIRPFGCRIFFCDATADQWQREQYERFHGQLKRLHDELGVPYAYVEWRSALRELDLMPAKSTRGRTNSLSLPQVRF